jgi:hypothetical protein
MKRISSALHTPGTITILRTLIRTHRAPTYARLYWRFRRRVAARPAYLAHPAGFASSLYWLVAILLIGLCFLLSPCASMLWWVMFRSSRTELAWSLAVAGLALACAGAAAVAGQISRSIARERARRTWVDLLLLPYTRYTVILYSVAQAYTPLISMAGLLGALLAVPLAGRPSLSAILVMWGLLGVEWFQLQALSVAFGLAGAAGQDGEGRTLIPLLLAGLAILGRAGGGWLVAAVSGVGDGTRIAGLLVGPLIRVVASGPWGWGVAAAALYLLALEGVVRVVFAVCIRRMGEG